MDLFSDSEDKFNADLNELVKETYDKSYQDEVKKHTEILAYRANPQQASTSTAHSRQIKPLPKRIKTPDSSIRSTRTYALRVDGAEEIPTKVKEPLNKRMKRYSRSSHKIESYKKVDPPKRSSKTTHKSVSSVKDAYVNSSNIEPKVVEKMTYCRPVLNQEFIYKTMDTNIRLQELVTRLLEAREKKKNNEAWNNYINDLRNKHRYQSNVEKEQNNVPDENNQEMINYYDTKFSSWQSNPCQNLLDDIYSISNVNNLSDYYNQNSRSDISNNKRFNISNDSHCYPTCSLGRIMTKMNNQRRMYQQPRSYGGNSVYVEKDYERYIPSPQIKRKNETQTRKNMVHFVKNLAVQTDFDVALEGKQSTFKEKYSYIQGNVDRLKQKIMKTESNKALLSNIENKLDILIDSVQKFMCEIRIKRVKTSDRSTGSSNRSIDDQLTEKEKEHVIYSNNITCGVAQGKHFLIKDSLDKIMYEERNKSDKVKRDIEEILHNPQNPCSVNIMFDIPTKERSTEVTDSLCKTVQNPRFTVEEVCKADADHMTIAVNTEPLGILALLRISTESVKQMLSYMPQIDYNAYLSRLQFKQVGQRPRIAGFECKICGASFERPSLLSDHIVQQHNMVTTRDCCICRHVMDRNRGELFKCRYCGQTFTRAYCRELHQQECARNLGRLHESFMLLT